MSTDGEQLFNKLKSLAAYSLAKNPNCTLEQARNDVVPAKPFDSAAKIVFDLIFTRAFEQAKSERISVAAVEYEVYYDALNALHQLAAAQIDKGARTVDESMKLLEKETQHLNNALFNAHYATAFEIELKKKESGQGERGVTKLERCGSRGPSSFCGAAHCQTCQAKKSPGAEN